MKERELFKRVKELGPKQASIILLLERAMHWRANASPKHFNQIVVCKTLVLQREDLYDFILYHVLIMVQPV